MAVQQVQGILEQAKQAKRLNDLPRARNLLSQAIKADPLNEEAWLLFADLAEKPDHAIYSLEQVLKINPVNMTAVDRLSALKTPAPAPRPVTSPAANQAPAQPIIVPPVRQEAERERTIREERMHGAVFVLPFLMAAIGIGLGLFIGNLPSVGMNYIGLLAGGMIVLESLIELIKLSARYATSRLILTNKRIVIKRGFLNRNTFEVLLTKVEGIGVKRPLLGRLLGFGTIIVTGTGGAHQVFTGMHAPEAFRERVQAEIARTQA
ncbi:MAG: PH domain-containing protein [Chloroflexi bacterium]|nr:PH domain-containing protein [Chloroflexota bacterium]